VYLTYFVNLPAFTKYGADSGDYGNVSFIITGSNIAGTAAF